LLRSLDRVHAKKRSETQQHKQDVTQDIGG